MIHLFKYICYPFWATESSKSRKSQLIYHRGDCLAEMDFYGPRALVLPPAGLNWRPSPEWAWTDSGHSQYVLAEGKPQQAWICMQVHTGLVLSAPAPSQPRLESREPLYTVSARASGSNNAVCLKTLAFQHQECSWNFRNIKLNQMWGMLLK